ncbi:MAG: hypothetical protein CSA23_04945 [Deltaproteobacteria bacterium]|nr:MAG: hypothetical protein CSA23_04945 [Deltaproteobacteria bacterium]
MPGTGTTVTVVDDVEYTSNSDQGLISETIETGDPGISKCKFRLGKDTTHATIGEATGQWQVFQEGHPEFIACQKGLCKSIVIPVTPVLEDAVYLDGTLAKYMCC